MREPGFRAILGLVPPYNCGEGSMRSNRRIFVMGAASGLLATRSIGKVAAAGAGGSVRRIATEEAFATPELVKAWLEIARAKPESSLDVPTGIRSIFDNPRPG